jgi:protein-disulfide isomerase
MTGLRQARRPRPHALAFVALALTLAANGATAETAAPPDAPAAEALAATGPLPDIVEGPADAPVTIIEYASMTCSHCAAFHQATWPGLKVKYLDTGKARFILREFPLDPLATAAFMLARCAGSARRDALIDRLFDHQAEWAFAANPLFKLKAQVLAGGLSEGDFRSCLSNQELLNNINKARDIAQTKLQVRSTPTFFVNGVRLNGELSLEKFDEALAPMLR